MRREQPFCPLKPKTRLARTLIEFNPRYDPDL
jgi:hypothetical protein